MTTKQIVYCRYLRRNNEQCTAEAADPVAEVLLCTKHMARVVEHARETFARFRLESRR